MRLPRNAAHCAQHPYTEGVQHGRFLGTSGPLERLATCHRTRFFGKWHFLARGIPAVPAQRHRQHHRQHRQYPLRPLHLLPQARLWSTRRYLPGTGRCLKGFKSSSWQIPLAAGTKACRATVVLFPTTTELPLECRTTLYRLSKDDLQQKLCKEFVQFGWRWGCTCVG